MSKLITCLLSAVLAAAVVASGASAATHDDWSGRANQVCLSYIATAKKLFSKPVQPSGLYKFARDVKALESAELTDLSAIPNRSAAGAHALVVLKGDVALVDSAIRAWNRGDKAGFVNRLKAYLNDNRPKVAFKAAGASKCG